MSSTSDLEALRKATKVMNFVFLGVTVILQSLFFLKFKLKVDKAAIFILIVYLAVFLSRIWLDGVTYSIADIIQPICTTLVYAALLYFMFEMALVYSILASLNPRDHQKKKKMINVTRVAMFALLLGVFMPTNVINHKDI
jgi:intracellular septation protein A